MGLVPDLVPHRSGALWLPAHGTAIFADLHLGYTWAQRRRGQLGPLTDGGILTRMRDALDDLQPSRVVLLGDVYHAPRPSESERNLVAEGLKLIAGELVVVRGNHDRAMLRDFRIAAVPEWSAPGVLAVHGDAIPETAEYLIAGHFHPRVEVRDAAKVMRRLPAFVIGSRMCLLPAMSPFAAGVDYREIPVNVGRPVRVIAVTGRRAVAVRGRPRPDSRSAPSSPDSAG